MPVYRPCIGECRMHSHFPRTGKWDNVNSRRPALPPWSVGGVRPLSRTAYIKVCRAGEKEPRGWENDAPSLPKSFLSRGKRNSRGGRVVAMPFAWQHRIFRRWLIQEGMCRLSSHMQYIVFHPIVSSQALPLFVQFLVMLVFYVPFFIAVFFITFVHKTTCQGCVFIFIWVYI